MNPTDLAAAFEAGYGHPPSGVWSAPGRANLIGEHIDYCGGTVLPFALTVRTAVAVGPRDDGRLVVRSLLHPGVTADAALADLESLRGSGWPAYIAGSVWALLDAYPTEALDGGLDLLVDGDVPVGAGLSSSAALECATVLAIAELAGLTASRLELATIAQRAENDYVGMPCGLMDQAASLLAQPDRLLAVDTATLDITQIRFDVETLDVALLVMTTADRRALTDGRYAATRRAIEAAVKHVGPVDAIGDESIRRAAQHVGGERRRVHSALDAIGDGDMTRLGELITLSHRSLRDLLAVSSPDLDRAVEAALAAGAYGARMTGAGFGGSAIALVPADEVSRAIPAIRASFRRCGRPEPALSIHRPSAGARRDR